MKRFAHLIDRLDETTSTTRKVEALRDYFAEAPDNDKLWTIALLSHRRPKRTVRTALLREWAAEEAGIPLWLFEDSYHVATLDHDAPRIFAESAEFIERVTGQQQG